MVNHIGGGNEDSFSRDCDLVCSVLPSEASADIRATLGANQSNYASGYHSNDVNAIALVLQAKRPHLQREDLI